MAMINFFQVKKNSAFSLLEIVVAITILSLIAAGFFSAIISSRNLIWRSKKRVQGVEIARRTLEGLRQFVRADTWDYTNASNPLRTDVGWTAWTAVVDFPEFQTRYIVAPVSSADCRNVTVQVRWNESSIF